MNHHGTGDVMTERKHAVTTQSKRERLDLRLNADQKALIQHAAELEGRTVSDFVVDSARHAAEAVIRSHQVIALTARDSRTFVEALQSPPEPNAALRSAFARYVRDVEER
jgi:uncharacterized protein (DUF1778 family)